MSLTGSALRFLMPSVISSGPGAGCVQQTGGAPTADNGVVAVLDSESVFFFDAEGRPGGVFPVRSILPKPVAVRSIALGVGSLYLLVPDGVFCVPDPRLRGGPKHIDGVALRTPPSLRESKS